ncbi:hypothetical protein EC988_007379, partial [Linderina pennispora]
LTTDMMPPSSAARSSAAKDNITIKYLRHLLNTRHSLDTYRQDVLPHVHREIMNQFVEEKTRGRLSKEMTESINRGMDEISNSISNVDASAQRITEELARIIDLFASAISMPTVNSKAMADIREDCGFIIIKKQSFDLVKFAMDPSGYIERFLPMSLDEILSEHDRWRTFLYHCVPPLIKYFILIELATVISWNRAKGKFNAAFRCPVAAIKLYEERVSVTCAEDYSELMNLCVAFSSEGSKKRKCHLRYLAVACNRRHQSMLVDGLWEKQVKD